MEDSAPLTPSGSRSRHRNTASDGTEGTDFGFVLLLNIASWAAMGALGSRHSRIRVEWEPVLGTIFVILYFVTLIVLCNDYTDRWACSDDHYLAAGVVGFFTALIYGIVTNNWPSILYWVWFVLGGFYVGFILEMNIGLYKEYHRRLTAYLKEQVKKEHVKKA